MTQSSPTTPPESPAKTSPANPSTSKTLRNALVGILAAIIAAAALLAWLAFGDRSLPAAPVSVEVPSGYGIGQIAAQLQDAGVVRSGLLFKYYARSRGIATHVNAAIYDFPPHESFEEIVSVLVAGGHPSVTWVTIPEGYSARQIAHRLEAQHLASAADFLDVVWHQSLLLDNTLTRGLEGYLYPDTYQFRRGATPDQIATQMTEQFRKKLPRDWQSAARRLGYTLPQIVTLASIIENEAKVNSERPIMAGVYYNRLRIGMPLEVDATIEYALPQHKSVLHYSDLAIDSPYNTYTHTGLPPTPISNPGVRSIFAALHPAKTNYLYYVYAGNGHHHFSRTLEQQRAAEQRYLH
jgi:UPF0755 protein